MLFHLFFEVFKNKFSSRFFIIILTSLIVIVVCAGLIAVKVIPNQDLSLNTQRVEGFSLSEAKEPVQNDDGGGYKSFKNIIRYFILPTKIDHVEGPASISIIGLLLILLTCFIWRQDKNIGILFLLAIVGFWISSGGILFDSLWKYLPFFNKFRGPERYGLIFILPMTILVGYGAKYLFDKLKGRLKYIILIVISGLIILNLWIYTIEPMNIMMNYDVEKSQYSALQLVSSDQPYLYRIHSLDVTGVEGNYQVYTEQLKIPILYGYTGQVWFPKYFYGDLSAMLKSPAKVAGMLNTKYFFSTKEYNLSGLKLIQTFSKCEKCRMPNLAATYLYLNQEYLPKYWFINNSILVSGELDGNKQTMLYSLIFNDNFNPKTTILIDGSVDNEDFILSNKYNSIILSMMPSSNSADLLYSFSMNHNLIPNIYKNETTFKSEKIDNILKSIDSQVEPIDIISYSPNKVILHLNNKNGFVAIGDHLNLFEGWHAYVDGKETKIYNANGVMSAVYVKSYNDLLELEFSPKSFIVGSWITIFTILFIILYLVVSRKWT